MKLKNSEIDRFINSFFFLFFLRKYTFWQYWLMPFCVLILLRNIQYFELCGERNNFQNTQNKDQKIASSYFHHVRYEFFSSHEVRISFLPTHLAMNRILVMYRVPQLSLYFLIWIFWVLRKLLQCSFWAQIDLN